MKAIILAAGRGSRLNKYTQNIHKCMLNFKGMTLLGRQLETLKNCGISDISIVRGYQANKINYPGVKYYFNADYENTNMVESLFCAEKELNDDVLICYSDIIYQPDVVKKNIVTKAEIGVTVDRDYWPYWQARLKYPASDVESMVINKQGKITELGENRCSLDKARTRYIGLIRLSKTGTDIFKRVYHDQKAKYFDKENEPWKRSKSFKKGYMTCFLQAVIDSGYAIEPVYIDRGWLEFDTDKDYENAIEWSKNGILEKFLNLGK